MIEAELWEMAGALRGSMDTAEYEYVVLSLVFPKYVSDAYDETRVKLDLVHDADPEDSG